MSWWTRMALCCAATSATVIGLVVTDPALVTAAGAAGVTQSQVVSAVPGVTTPEIEDGTVFAITSNGSRIIVGGSFTRVAAPAVGGQIGASVTRTGIFAFAAATGAIDAHFAPVLDKGAVVEAVWPGPSANTVYVAGTFRTVNGRDRRGLIKLNLTSGRRSRPFKVKPIDGTVTAVQRVGHRLIITGTFTSIGGVARGGLAELNARTGKLKKALNIPLTGHHNYRRTGDASGLVGGRDLDISPDGRRLVVIGNFKRAGGALRDQIVMIDLGSNPVIDAWNTAGFTARCSYRSFDSYVRHIQFSPDGSYFVVTTTGAGGVRTTNSDGTRTNCDAASRWTVATASHDVIPTWVSRTGNDTLLGVAITGTAVYVGGHQRWLNNDQAFDAAGPGAVPRPGLAALDPATGVPLAWNPGRNPRGAGAYALYATRSGLYVGSDTKYFGNFRYRRDRIGFFPLAGGAVPASTATRSLPANVYVPGPLSDSAADPTALIYHAQSGTTTGPSTVVSGTGIDWSATRGAFMVGSTIYFGRTDGHFYKASFNGTVGPAVDVNPYEDPAWSAVATGSGQTYRGVVPSFYAELPSLTSAFYNQGRLYYGRAGLPGLYWRSLSPDSAIVGSTESVVRASVNFGIVTGAFISGSSVYYATGSGNLYARSFSHGVIGAAYTLISGPSSPGAPNWSGRSLFAFGDPS